MKFVGEFRWFCVQSQKNEWFTRVKSMNLVRDFRWLFLPAPGWTRSNLLRKVTFTLAEEASKEDYSHRSGPTVAKCQSLGETAGRSTIPVEDTRTFRQEVVVPLPTS